MKKRLFDLGKVAGYRTMPPLDPEQHPARPGLEGPFRTNSGRVLYYDPREGQYYDPSTDMYVSNEEYEAATAPRPHQSGRLFDISGAQKTAQFGGYAEMPSVPADNPLHTNPQQAGRSVGAVVIPQASVTLNGTSLMIESLGGSVQISLTPEQQQQLAEELPNLVK